MDVVAATAVGLGIADAASALAEAEEISMEEEEDRPCEEVGIGNTFFRFRAHLLKELRKASVHCYGIFSSLLTMLGVLGDRSNSNSPKYEGSIRTTMADSYRRPFWL